MKSYSQKFMSRFLKSRVWPISSILFLFLGLVLIAGFILWEARISQEFSLMGEIDIVPHSTGTALREGEERVLLVLKSAVDNVLPVISPRQSIQIIIEARPGEQQVVETTFVQYDKDGPFKDLILELNDGNQLNNTLLSQFISDARPENIGLRLRTKRLLLAALEKNKVNF